VKLKWTRPALTDLRGIDSYLSQCSRETAARILASIRASADILASFPAMGPSLDSQTRSLQVRQTPYVLIYRIEGDRISLLRIYHNRQNWRPE